MEPRVSLILTCYNEMEHIVVSLRKINEHMRFVFGADGYEIVLVDDYSTDGTRDFLRGLESSPVFQVYLNEKNLGRGGAVKRGLSLARGRVTGFMDIDCEVSEYYLPICAQLIEEGGADLVVGARTYTVQPNPRSWARHLASLGYKQIVHRLLATEASDSEAGYKFFSGRMRELILAHSKFDSWFWDTEAVQLCTMAGYRLREINVLFVRNPHKTSTVRFFRDIWEYLKAIKKFKALLSGGAYAIPRGKEDEARPRRIQANRG